MKSGAGSLPGSSDGSSLSVTKFSGSISFLTDLKVLSISNNQLLYVNEVIAECCTQLEEVAALSFLCVLSLCSSFVSLVSFVRQRPDLMVISCPISRCCSSLAVISCLVC